MQTSCPLCSLAEHTVDPVLQTAWGGSLDFCREDISTDLSKELLFQQSASLKLSFPWLSHPSLPQLQVRNMPVAGSASPCAFLDERGCPVTGQGGSVDWAMMHFAPAEKFQGQHQKIRV